MSSTGVGGAFVQRYTLAVVEAINNPPVITSNPENASAEGISYTYDVDATDADDDVLSFRLITFPAGMTIVSTTGEIGWSASGAQAGDHPVVVEVADGRGGVDTQTFAITVANLILNAPVITSTPTFTATVGGLYQYPVTASDDDGDLLTFSLTDAPVGMTIRAETGLIQWTPTTAQVGSHPVAIQVKDTSDLTNHQSFVLTVLPPAPERIPPSVTLAIDPPMVQPGQETRITVAATDNVGVVSRALTVNGVSLTLSITGTTTFSSTTSGLYTAIGTAADAAGNTATATAIFRVSVPTDTTTPTISLRAPAEDTVIEQVASIIGTADDANLAHYELSLAPIGEDTWTPFASGTAPVVDGVLGHLDPTLLQNGVYRVRLRAEDLSGNSSQTERVYRVQGDAKVGIFTLSFTDLEVPVAGLPLQVVRTYDSRDKRVGDFGVGWTLDLATVRLQENATPGDHWRGASSGGIFSTYCIQPTRLHIVTITLPDGTVYEFEPTLSPQCQQLAPPSQITVGFRPLPGTSAALAPFGGALATVEGPFPGLLDLVDFDTLAPYDPQQYRLTLQDGRVLLIDEQAGLQSIADLNGNMLTITRNGISHSSGKGVTFHRDTQDRITSISDPRGTTINYAYDLAGDLVSVTDQVSNTTHFTYNRSHGLLTIEDPRGLTPIRNEYDEAGRLIAHVDADGHRVEYTHRIGERQEAVRDRLGRSTVYNYDVHGNVLSQTDPLGHTTSFTYDARGNTLSETDPLGHTTSFTYDGHDNLLTQTDPLGHTTSYTYNERGQVLTTTDPLGRVTINSYDLSGNLVATKDPLGYTTSYTYNKRGLQSSMTDPLSNTTRYEYDDDDNLKKETDARGHATTYTYDENGNRETQTTSRTRADGTVETLTTAYAYDNLNRLIKITYPDGSTTETVYNSIGQQEATIDQLGRRTEYFYDSQGRLVRTRYPDGTAEESRYDAEGRRVTSIDRAGHATTYTYDGLGRLVTTTFPDGASTGMTYDEAGRTIAATDALSHTTRYEYDQAGRQTKVIDAAGHTTIFTYDKVGNQLIMTDALSYTTTYEYDANNRRTKVIFADGTIQVTKYDALGRSIAQIDQAGLTTHYEYDELGRLIGVTDALSQTTRYAYDELGNQVAQIDALSRTTTFAYDTLGRRTARTLPLGMTETYGYDLAGNMRHKTDFNGHTTTYDYDNLSRLLGKTPDPRLGQPAVRFTYTPTGQRATMADAGGLTTYSYDERDRLLSKTTPFGTLTYSYDAAGNLRSIRSSNADGAWVDYAYDELNRLAAATDNRLAGTTTYAYDANGNLARFSYPNGVETRYTYDRLNRLTEMQMTRPAITLASYTYDLGPSGNRRSATELSGRTASYTYDDLYRLTQEMIANDGAGANGTIGYTYDAVGNRLTRTSTLPDAVPPAAYAYDANDRLASDSYDANGNTIASGGHTYAYDFENRLIAMDGGAVTIVYDGDGNRVAKTVGGVTTHYLVDDRNLTGYAQVLEELSAGAVQRSYTYGHDLLSQRQRSGDGWAVSFYGYDGHGSVRLLVDSSGAITDRYDYDAFGVLIGSAGGTANVYQYAGEQYDPSLESYHLRARYYNQQIGRFVTIDPWRGNPYDPPTLHKYVYVQNNPAVFVDPSGQATLTDVLISNALVGILGKVISIKADEIFRKKFLTLGEVAEQVGIAAVSGAAGGLGAASAGHLASRLLGFQAKTLLKTILRTGATSAFAGATSATVATISEEFLRGLLDWVVLRKPIQFTTSAGELRNVTFGGFFLGGFSAIVRPYKGSFNVSGVGISNRVEAISFSELESTAGTFASSFYDVFTEVILGKLDD